MESSSWPESLPSNQMKAIQELTQGQHLVNDLREMLRQPEKMKANTMAIDGVVVQILGMFNNTLSILNSCSFSEITQIQRGYVQSPSNQDGQRLEDSDESVKTATPLKIKRECHKKRKNSWTSAKIIPALVDDGYAWRKYGQKFILNAKHQRSYYRCTHKFDQGCRATKLVQQTEDEPPKYKITYNGHHTCKNVLRAPQIILDSPNSMDTSTLLSFETKGLIGKQQNDSYFPSLKQEGFVSSYNEYLLADHDLSCDQITQLQLETKSMMSSIDHEDMMSSRVYSSTASTRRYDMDQMLGNTDFDDFPFEFCS